MKYLWNLLIAACAMATTADGALISEFVANPPGDDPATQDFELAGTPLAPFDLWIISIESDGFNGMVDRSTNVMGSYDAGGLAVVTIPDLENPSFTVALLGLGFRSDRR